jgi:tRNA(fMet)-specific endonuclease VapC
MDIALLDTDMLSELLKQRNSNVKRRATQYARAHGQFAFSEFARFELDRGSRESGASTQRTRFEAFCQHSLVLPVTSAVFDLAADLWVLARRGGHPHADADILIAATARHAGRALVTGNTAHFAWIPGLVLEDWRAR